MIMRTSRHRFEISAATTIAAVFSLLWVAAPAAAIPTQEDVLKSISDNVGGKSDPTPLLWGMGGIVAVAMLLALFNRRWQRKALPKPLNNRAKLMKELMQGIDLRPAELRQLKVLAEAENL